MVQLLEGPWEPSIDGWLIPDSPLHLYQQGKTLSLPILGGYTTDEGTTFVPGSITNLVTTNTLTHLYLAAFSFMDGTDLTLLCNIIDRCWLSCWTNNSIGC
jgi:hypothetical protein